MLTDAFRVLVNNQFYESLDINFMAMKKDVKALIVFFFLISSPIKTFFNWIVNQYPKGIRLHGP